MEFKAEIKKTFTGPDKLRAVCSVILDDCFLVKNVRVVEGEKGLFVSLPSRRNVKGEWVEHCFPMTKELREKLGCDAVIHMDPVVTDDRGARLARQDAADAIMRVQVAQNEAAAVS